MENTLLKLPQCYMTERNSEMINSYYIPYPIRLYGCGERKGPLRTLKAVVREVQDLMRRYVLIFPQALEIINVGDFRLYRCIVHDENTGVTRGVLEKLGYVLEETGYSAYNLYAITLKSKTELKKP